VIIADTGFWLALANAKDRFHRAAVQALDRAREPLICTWTVMTETCHLMAARLSVDAELAFVRSASSGAFQVFDLELGHLERIQVLMDKYRDLPMNLADGSLVVLAEELGSGRILSTDQRDFRRYRWKTRKPFRNLLVL
jgi:predicted nucleic acid-binding protein